MKSTMPGSKNNPELADSSLRSQVPLPQLHTWERPEFICGWGAAFVNISVTFPINKIMFRQQLYGVRTLRAIGQLQKEGVRHIYRGLLPPLLQKTTSMSLMFGLYYEFQRQLNYFYPSMNPSLSKSAAAMLAGTVEAVLTPFERVQVLMQDRNYHKQYNNTIHAFRELGQSHGVREFYRGQSAILLRNGPSNVLFFLGRDYLSGRYSDTDSASQKVLLDFVSGALLGSFISTVFYPLNVLKVRMQSQLGGDCTLYSTFKVILAERDFNVKKLFRGVHINYTRSLLSWGIVNATYEFLMHNVFKQSTSYDS